MGTFYFSPIYMVRWWIAKVRGNDLPRYKIYGRNFLDDHTLFERIYPAAGTTLNDKAFQNLFVGLNWEIARGGSLFAGYHFGRVNVLRSPNTFTIGQSAATQEQFDLWTDKTWKTNFALGVNLDLMVVTNLFRQTPAK
jgi:hypothetical protein